jgi:DNA-binding HxlR family transcriptional regulator
MVYFNAITLNGVDSYSGHHQTGEVRREMATKPAETNTTTQTYQMCPRYEHAIQLLGKRWTGLILDSLMDGPRRFCELTATVEGLSDRVLSDRLRELEAEGIVERVVYPQIPVRVEYRLTEKGLDLRPVVQAIHEWAQQWIELPHTSEEDITEYNKA